MVSYYYIFRSGQWLISPNQLSIRPLTNWSLATPHSSPMSECWHRWVTYYCDVMIWKHFPHYWPFVRRIHRSPANQTGLVMWCFGFHFIMLNRLLNKQYDDWRFETHWRCCYVTTMRNDVCSVVFMWYSTESWCRDHSEYGLSQWETTLQCNVVSRWLSPCSNPQCYNATSSLIGWTHTQNDP